MNTTPFGQQLRTWRKRAGLSQLALSSLAETTPRHLSFVETGRSRPGTELVLRLGQALGLGMREQNDLLRAAGLAPVFIEHGYEDEAMQQVRRVITQIIERHEPYPAWVIQGGLRFIQANGPGHALFPGITQMSPPELVEMWFAPGPFRDALDNWEDVAQELFRLLQREAAQHPSEDLEEAMTQALTYLDEAPRRGTYACNLPVICPIWRVGQQRIHTLSSVLRFETATSPVTESLRVELMFPVDEAGEAFFAELAAQPRPTLA